MFRLTGCLAVLVVLSGIEVHADVINADNNH